MRTCAREEIKTIQEAQKVLEKEVERYNYHQVHSTPGEIPILGLERATKEKKSLSREFTVSPSYKSLKDIFLSKSKKKNRSLS